MDESESESENTEEEWSEEQRRRDYWKYYDRFPGTHDEEEIDEYGITKFLVWNFICFEI